MRSGLARERVLTGHPQPCAEREPLPLLAVGCAALRQELERKRGSHELEGRVVDSDVCVAKFLLNSRTAHASKREQLVAEGPMATGNEGNLHTEVKNDSRLR